MQVQGELGAADGAPVTIEVVLQDKPGVLTVPIAAVKQNGQGEDVVRVDRPQARRSHQRGEGRRPACRKGSFIEIKSGLKGNEVVVVEVDNRARGRPLADAEPGPLLELEGVSRVYGEQVKLYALREVSLQIHAGDVTGDRRAVGLGQVDDARPARRARPPDRGHGPVAGQDVTELDDADRSTLRGDSIGFVFQQFHLIPHLTALGNVATALLYRGLTRKPSGATGRWPRSSRWASGPAPTTGHSRCPAASSNASPSPARS